MPRWLTWTLAALLAAVGGAALAAHWSWRELNAELALPTDGVLFEIPSGAALATVTRDLAARGIVRHPQLIDWYARFSGTATRIQAGEYRLQPGLSALSLLEKLGRGEVLLHQFTIIEGWRFEEMIGRLREHPAIVAGSETGAEIMALLGPAETHPEGQFLPDTYTFPRGTRDTEVLAWAHDALTAVLDEAWRVRDDDGVLTDPYQGLILASIIEKETALETERALIAGVFHGRIRSGMRLQTDPTVIYGLGDTFDGNLTRAHLASDTPYNTYTRHGLPPTPIALAGRASITAALQPAVTEALYFVATGEPDGSHYFSVSLDEHNAAVSRFLERQRAAD
jgi:UPF0755 protein